jgi:uncharacterized protein
VEENVQTFENEEVTLVNFLVLLLVTGFVTFFVWAKGYYRFPQESLASRRATLLQTFLAFVIFFVPGAALAPFVPRRFYYALAFMNVGLAAALLSLYSKLTVFKGAPQFSPRDFFKGASTWLVAYPQMLVLSLILNFVIVYLFEFTPSDQTSVAELKRAKEQSLSLFVFLLLIVSFIVPICEEILFRGYLQNFFKNMFSRGTAIILTSLIFALFHFTFSQGSGNFVILPSLFFLSLYLGFVYEKLGSISAPIGLHAMFNFISTLMIMQTS